jgi:hypothetical protein
VVAADDEFELEKIAHEHRIGAEIFVPFAIKRLSEGANATDATLTIKLRNVRGEGEIQRKLRLLWSAENALSKSVGVQEHIVTEWAACGVACAVLALYTNFRIREVTMIGDRFDYWVSDNGQEYGLEVSGTTTEELEARHNAKVHQLRDNPYGIDGFVIVVGFETKEVILSFCRFQEET